MTVTVTVEGQEYSIESRTAEIEKNLLDSLVEGGRDGRRLASR